MIRGNCDGHGPSCNAGVYCLAKQTPIPPRADTTPVRIWVEDLQSGERAYKDTTFNGRGKLRWPSVNLPAKHALAMFVAAFGVIIAVNLVLAYNAVKTFPGLEVKNSYVASQEFNERLQGTAGAGVGPSVPRCRAVC